MGGVAIRPARESDAAALAEIHSECCRYYAEMDPDAFQVPNEDGLVEWFASFLRQPPKENELSLVAELDGHVVGSLEARLEEPMETADRQMLRELGETRLFVNAMGVHPAHWRSGVGTALMHTAEEWAKQRGATRSGLDTYMDSPVSVPFYEKLGYERHSINFRRRL